jgi:hypothetical protein
MLKEVKTVSTLLNTARNNLVDALWYIDDMKEQPEFKAVSQIVDNLELVITHILKDGENNGR